MVFEFGEFDRIDFWIILTARTAVAWYVYFSLQKGLIYIFQCARSLVASATLVVRLEQFVTNRSR